MTGLFTQPAGATFTAPAPAAPAFEHPPTPEQAAILDATTSGGNLVIEAGAGTGKTTTLRMVASACPQQRMLYIAYNRAIADDARASFPGNVHCATAHSLAFAAVGRQFQARLNGPRLPAREVARILAIPAVLDLGKHALTSVKVARLVADTVRAFCHSDDAEILPRHVPAVPGIEGQEAAELRTATAAWARRAWDDITSLNGRLRFEHDHYLKLWAMGGPHLPYHLILLDEAQDANPLIASVVTSQQAQQILVGDQSQAIYGWRGAVDAMETFAGQRLALSQSFRFGDGIAHAANAWLDILDAPLRLSGNPRMNSSLGVLDAPAAILCRTNACAVAAVMEQLAAGRKVALAGGGDDVRRLAEACRDLRNGRPVLHPELMAFASWAEVQEFAEHDSGGSDLKTFVRLVDQHGPDAVIGLVDRLHAEEIADVVVSTAHKAKGREWDTVRISSDFRPEPYDDLGGLIREEAMLAYVATTRAKTVLDPGPLAGVSGLMPEPKADLIGPALTDVRDAPDEPPYIPEPAAAELPSVARGWLDLARQAADNAKHWKAIADHAVQRLQELAGDAQEATIDGNPAFTWRTSKTSTYVDAKALREDHPDIYAKYAKTKKAARPFNLDGEWK